MSRESPFTIWVEKLLRDDGAIVVPLVASLAQSGWPDRYVCHRDWLGLLELKGDNTKTSHRQRYNINLLNKRRRGSAFVVRSAFDGGITKDEFELDHDFSRGLVFHSNGKMCGTFRDVKELIAILVGVRDRVIEPWDMPLEWEDSAT